MLVELSAVSTDSLLHCSGSVMVDVVAGMTHTATVYMQCRGPGSIATGGVLVDGRFDNCPYFQGYSVTPLTASGLSRLTARVEWVARGAVTEQCFRWAA